MLERGIRSITQTLAACPVQYDGVLGDGRVFYFRARHEGWKFGVGETKDEAVAAAMGEEGLFALSGEHDNASWMPAAEAELIIADCVFDYFKNRGES